MAKYDLNLREEEIKLKVAKDWFSGYDTTQIKGNIDFSVCVPTEPGQLETLISSCGQKLKKAIKKT